MKNPLGWLQRKIEESFEERIERFEAFTEYPKKPRKHRKLARISPSRKLVWGTTLAVMVFLCFFTLELAMILHLGTFNDDIAVGMLVIVSWIGGTYFGHRG